MNRALLVARDDLSENDRILQMLRKRIELVDRPPTQETGIILVLGGDGTMFKAIRQYHQAEVPFVGINKGHIGFLMNDPKETVLEEIIQGAIEIVTSRLLVANLYATSGLISRELAFNDFYFERAGVQTVKVRVTVNGTVSFDPLICDGIIVCSPAGSTAYNASAGGHVLPLDSNNLVVTGICPALFHNWRSAIVSENTDITLEAVETDKRPVRFLADGIQIAGVTKAVIHYADERVQLGFANSQGFREKVTDLQFNRLR